MAPIKILVSQAHSIKLYKNIRTKVMKCCANIYFNKQGLIKKAKILKHCQFADIYVVFLDGIKIY